MFVYNQDMGRAGASIDERSLAMLADPLAVAPETLPESLLYELAEQEIAVALAADVLELQLVNAIVAREPTCGADKVAASWLHRHSTLRQSDARAEVAFAIGICAHRDILIAYAGSEISRREAKRILKFLEFPPKNATADDLPEIRSRLLKAARTHNPSAVHEEEELIRQAFTDDLPPAEDHDRNELFIDRGMYGRTFIRGNIDAETAAKFVDALRPLAAPRPEADGTADKRPAPLRRAEALSDLLDGYLAHYGRPSENGERPRLTVHIRLEDLFAHIPTHAERITLIRAGRLSEAIDSMRLGWNHWMGPVSLAAAQRLACDCELLMVGADENGAPLAVNTNDRFASKKHRQALADRDRGCSFPHCNRPAGMTQAHHIVPWETSADTNIDNLASLCGEHHRAIHHHGWEVKMATDRHPVYRPPEKIDPLRRWMNSQGNYIGGPESPSVDTG